MADRFWSSEEYDERAHDLYNDGDYDGALETLKEGLALYPSTVELYVGLGHARLAREEFAWARTAFERALVLDPGHEDAMVGLGEVVLRLGHHGEGVELFRRVEGLGYHDDVELMLTMGRALYRESLYAQARKVFSRLSAARPDCAEAVAAAGYSIHRMGDEVDACRHLRRALRIDPDLHEARTYLGYLLYDRGDWDGALREFERVPPSEQWDSLAVWRVMELKRAVGGLTEDDVSLTPWHDRLSHLEELEWDPVEQLLAEIEARVARAGAWNARDRNQLELVGSAEAESRQAPMLHVRLPGGQVLRGSSDDVVRQFRDHLGFSHEALMAFMKRMAERWHEQYGIEVRSSNPEGFLRSASEGGLLQLFDAPQDEPRGGRAS
ncbi:MAG: tetratricopeptide repeat protein [Gemmatimonadetes bacterium]|nr:tetratricopeptide repeat protein [Gemmatimonadota bacterium]